MSQQTGFGLCLHATATVKNSCLLAELGLPEYSITPNYRHSKRRFTFEVDAVDGLHHISGVFVISCA